MNWKPGLLLKKTKKKKKKTKQNKKKKLIKIKQTKKKLDKASPTIRRFLQHVYIMGTRGYTIELE